MNLYVLGKKALRVVLKLDKVNLPFFYKSRSYLLGSGLISLGICMN